MGCKMLKRVKIFLRQVWTCYGMSMNLILNLEVHPLESCEWQCEMQQMGWFEVVRGHSRTAALSPFNRAHTISYSTSIETTCLFCTVFDL